MVFGVCCSCDEPSSSLKRTWSASAFCFATIIFAVTDCKRKKRLCSVSSFVDPGMDLLVSVFIRCGKDRGHARASSRNQAACLVP